MATKGRWVEPKSLASQMEEFAAKGKHRSRQGWMGPKVDRLDLAGTTEKSFREGSATRPQDPWPQLSD